MQQLLSSRPSLQLSLPQYVPPSKVELEWPSCQSLPGLKTNRTTTDQKHQIIKVPLTKAMQIPFNTDDRFEVAVRQVLRHVHPVLSVRVLISIHDFDFETVVSDNTVVLVILNH